MAVENDQVSVCTGPEGALLVLDPEASRGGKDERRRPRSAYTCQRLPRRVECRAFDRFSERATRELHKVADALVQGDHAKEETGIDEQNCGEARPRNMAETERTSRRASWCLLDRACRLP